MIIIEGPDSSGKSTLVKWIRDNTLHSIVKPYYPKREQLSYYLHTGAFYRGSFLERYYLSEIVYPRFKLNRPVMESWKQFLIEASLQPYAPVIIYARPPKDIVLECLKNRGDEYVSPEEVEEMLNIYDWAIERSHIPVVRYNFDKDDPKEIIEITKEIYLKRKNLSGYFYPFLSSGDFYKSHPIMFIGDEPSNTSMGDGYIRAFISPNGSSSFLHKSLYAAGIYSREMPYFTNWGKGFDNDRDRRDSIEREIEVLRPKKIICLGKEIRDKVGRGEVLEHPSYVKRFYSKDYQWYIEKLKELTKE